MGRFINAGTWKRREHFEIYRAFTNPFWGVTTDVDVTRLWQQCAAEKRSFLIAGLYCALEAANDTEAFRLRIRPDGIWLHDRVGTSTTILRDDETFGFAIFRPAASYAAFEAAGQAEIERAKATPTLRTPAPGEDDLVYHSSLPWIHFTSFTNALGRGDDCIPRLVFGRVAESGGARRMPVAVEVHHGLVDGLDVARFLERFEQAMAGLK
jgi:chloramphenicol O-acetyltransferase type A